MVQVRDNEYLETLESEELREHLNPSATAPTLSRPNNLILQSHESND